MTDHELLLAISSMIEPVRNDVHEIRCRVTAIESKIDAMDIRLTAVESKVDAIDARLTAVESKVDAIETRVTVIEGKVDAIEVRVTAVEGKMDAIDNRVKKVELFQENKILPRLNNIESCYTSTFNRYKDSTEDYEMIKQDVSILKKVVTDHSEKLQKIG